MEDLFAELQGATMFSTIDLASANFQVLLHDENSQLPFQIPSGPLQFGLSPGWPKYHVVPITEPELVALLSTGLNALSVAEFSSESATCPELCVLRSQIEKGWPKTKKNVSPDLVTYFPIREKLSVQDGPLNCVTDWLH